MITAILGKPGAGKSYEATRLAIEGLKDGRFLFTNLPLALEHEVWKPYLGRIKMLWYGEGFEVQGGVKIRVEQNEPFPTEFWEAVQSPIFRRLTEKGVEKGPVLIFDELLFSLSPLEDEPKTAQRDLLVNKLLAGHRHMLMDIVMLSQGFEDVPKEQRKKVHEWVELTSFMGEGVPGYQYRVFNSWYGNRAAVSEGIRRYDKSRFGCYRSHAIADGIEERKDDGFQFKKRRWYMRWQLYVPILGLVIVGYAAPLLWERIGPYVTGEGGSFGSILGGAGSLGDGGGAHVEADEAPVVVEPVVEEAPVDVSGETAVVARPACSWPSGWPWSWPALSSVARFCVTCGAPARARCRSCRFRRGRGV